MSTPYEHGYENGSQWTAERVKERYGFAEECLADQESIYLEALDNLEDIKRKNPVYAVEHAAYLEGLIAGTRESLGKLIAKERAMIIDEAWLNQRVGADYMYQETRVAASKLYNAVVEMAMDEIRRYRPDVDPEMHRAYVEARTRYLIKMNNEGEGRIMLA